MFNLVIWLFDILGSLEMILRFMFQLIFWLFVIFCLVVWLMGNSGYEEGQKQFEEDNFLGQYYGKKSRHKD
ncbi:hypothetical protein ES708_28225 [subsurface metagenome]